MFYVGNVIYNRFVHVCVHVDVQTFGFQTYDEIYIQNQTLYSENDTFKKKIEEYSQNASKQDGKINYLEEQLEGKRARNHIFTK